MEYVSLALILSVEMMFCLDFYMHYNFLPKDKSTILLD